MWIQLISIALLIAALPLSVIWVSNDANKYRKLILVTTFLTFDLIMFGAFTRLTDSGLGCPDWPGCYGAANPFLAHADIHAAQTAMPDGPVTHFKAWVEMIHRYLAMAVGILILAQMVIAWIKRKQFEGALFFSIALFLFVCLQGAFGMWTVTLKLQPIVVTIHLLLGMVLLAMLVWMFERTQPSWDNSPLSSAKDDVGASRENGRGEGEYLIRHQKNWNKISLNSIANSFSHDEKEQELKWSARIAWLILLIQIALGGWVSTNYAVLACTDYPMCQGVLIPSMDFENGFSLWRKLGMTAQGEYLSFAALTAIHWVHRNFALLVIISSAYVAFRARTLMGLKIIANAIFTVLILQVGTGLANILFNWPLVIAVLHNSGAALLLILLTMLNSRIDSTSRMPVATR
ncbi:MAG: heme synthase [Solimicrobium sp.]|jgi:cytochrome c oxidase assembly protein subunit 15|nr:heme synthase [Solimicrobium sp.]